MVFGGKDGLPSDLAGKQAAGQRQPGDNRHAPLLGLGEKRLNGLLTEDVEDDLQRTEPRLIETPQGLVHRLDAGAKGPNLALPLQRRQVVEDMKAA